MSIGPFFAWIPGVPVPKGSTRAFKLPHSDRVVTTASNNTKLKPWAASVTCGVQGSGFKLNEGPVRVSLEFRLVRPKGHMGKKGLKPTAPEHPGTKPDLDKLARAVLDALTGVAFRDDSQVVRLEASKVYDDTGTGPGVEIRMTLVGPVYELDGEPVGGPL